MKTIDEIKQHRQVKALFDKAKEAGGTATIEATDRIVTVEIDGDKGVRALFLQNWKTWAKNAFDPPRGKGENGLVFMWQRGFFEPPKAPPTKPEGALPDADVMALIPRVPIDSQKTLGDVCRSLSIGIERAYPSIGLNESGYGLGKKTLIANILETLFAEGRISRSVKDAPRIVVWGLILHLQIEKGGVVVSEKPLPVATVDSVTPT